ncbi:ComEC/Rec2 family competence protein [Clostridium bowmanii]|nr:ComEC/Rec2 family competence protein [Clostridium bowmanii]MBU3189421.1 MBL fold metallo-hydrolase [Clostridium bowmanii]
MQISNSSEKVANSDENTKTVNENTKVTDENTKITQYEGKKTNSTLNGNLKVHFINVGQADSILIQQGSKFMLIDAGNNGDGKLVKNYLLQQGVKKLDYVIGTHPHEDHMGGLDYIINDFNIGKIFLPKATSTTKTFGDVVAAIKNKGMKATVPSPGETFNLGSAKCTILAPNSTKYKDLNNYSVVVKLEFGNNSFILTGDAEDISESEILQKGFNIKADVLKVGHHGSRSSTSDEFLAKVNPKYAIISTEKGNDYGHPHKETMDKLKNKNIPVYRTDELGTIIATSNGKTISFNTKPGSYSAGRP